MHTSTRRRWFVCASDLLPALAMLVATPATAQAQERAGNPRPVPRLGAPQALPLQLPRSMAAGNGVPFALQRQDREQLVVWFDTVSRKTKFARDPGELVERIEQVENAPHSLLVGDFDGDGTEEVVARFMFRLVRLVVDLVPQHEPKAVRVQDDGPWFAGRAADWDGDGLADIAFFSGSRVMLHHKVFEDGPTTVLLDLGPNNLSPDATAAGTIGDWDLDGLVDLVLALPERGLVWCRNEGARHAPKFSAPIPLWPKAPGEEVLSLVLVPVDDDPWPDLIVSTAIPGNDDTHGFPMRKPRLRTPAETQAMQAAEAERAALRASRPMDGLERLGLQRPGNPFELLLEQKQLVGEAFA